jgi:hypothetical protein
MRNGQVDARQRGEVVVVVCCGFRWWCLCGCTDRVAAQWTDEVATRVLPLIDTRAVEGMATYKGAGKRGLHVVQADRALVAGGGRCCWGYRVVVVVVCCSGPGPHRPRLLLLSAHGLAAPPSPAAGAGAAAACPMPMPVVEPSGGEASVKTTRVVLVLHLTPTYLTRSTNDVSTHVRWHGHCLSPFFSSM